MILSQAKSSFERLKVQSPSILSGPKATSGSSIVDDVTGNYGFRTKDAQVGLCRKALSYSLLACLQHFLSSLTQEGR